MNLDSLGQWIQWAKYISIFSYAMQVNKPARLEFNAAKAIKNKNVQIIKENLDLLYSFSQSAWAQRWPLLASAYWCLWISK